MSKVLNVKEDNFESNGETVICFKVELDDRTKPVPCYNAAAGSLKVGDPLPDGWEVKVSAKGKDYLYVPKAGGGKGGGGFAAAFRNTEAGFKQEQDSIHRSVALKLAVKEVRQHRMVVEGTEVAVHDTESAVTMLFNFYLKLLRGEGQTDATQTDGAKRTSDPIPAPTSEVTGMGKAQPQTESKGVAVSPGGEGAATPADNDLWAGVDVS